MITTHVTSKPNRRGHQRRQHRGGHSCCLTLRAIKSSVNTNLSEGPQLLSFVCGHATLRRVRLLSLSPKQNCAIVLSELKEVVGSVLGGSVCVCVCVGGGGGTPSIRLRAWPGRLSLCHGWLRHRQSRLPVLSFFYGKQTLIAEFLWL